ncbi:hypothetical protein BVRB_1g014100 [Beta vulgaris subsp. vulgaris]|nr:hypothetical protein BVRB_1g014100 [Beta vulgaris subsp. vulgaris]
MDYAYQFVISNHGIDTENDYPYEARQKSCNRNKVVAIKRLDHNGLQGNREFPVEVLMLSLLHHPNLVNLIRYCADGDQRLLVYEYMPLGSLEDHLYGMILARHSLLVLLNKFIILLILVEPSSTSAYKGLECIRIHAYFFLHYLIFQFGISQS